MSEHERASFTRVVAAGASHVVETELGSELRIYGSPEDAIRGGVSEETATRLFQHIAGSGELRDILPLCAVSNDVAAVTCDPHGCPGNCRLWSVPSNWQHSDPPPRREPDVAIRDTGRIYFCECDRGDG